MFNLKSSGFFMAASNSVHSLTFILYSYSSKSGGSSSTPLILSEVLAKSYCIYLFIYLFIELSGSSGLLLDSNLTGKRLGRKGEDVQRTGCDQMLLNPIAISNKSVTCMIN